MINMDTKSLTISKAVDQIRAGSLGQPELIQAFHQEAERLNPTINAFITLLPPDSNRVNAPASAALPGIPVAVKDLYETAGIRTTSGTTFFKDFVPERDAAAVERLKAAGAVISGKANTHEIALGLTGINPHYGAVHNPWDLQRITGGSSSGSAAAVASGMCLAATGTDTGGSIRIPSSLCGVVGLKPTYGRVSVRGILPLSWNLDHAGPLTKTVRDAAIMLGVLAEYDELDPVSVNIPVDDYLSNIEAGVKGWRVAFLDSEFSRDSDPEVFTAVQEAGRVFENLGARLEKVELNILRDAAMANGMLVQSDGAAFHRERLKENPMGFGEDVRQRLQNGASLSSSDYAHAHRIQVEMRRRMELFFQDFDILLLPTTPITAGLIMSNNAFERARPLTRFTAPFNLTGLPALSLPCGFASNGMPIGLQIVAPHWSEKQLLQAGHAYEQATEWHLHRPNL